jgi:hypothetical protein
VTFCFFLQNKILLVLLTFLLLNFDRVSTWRYRDLIDLLLTLEMYGSTLESGCIHRALDKKTGVTANLDLPTVEKIYFISYVALVKILRGMFSISSNRSFRSVSRDISF